MSYRGGLSLSVSTLWLCRLWIWYFACWYRLLNRRVTWFESRVVQNGDAEMFDQVSCKLVSKFCGSKIALKIVTKWRAAGGTVWQIYRTKDFFEVFKIFGWLRDPGTRTFWIKISLYLGTRTQTKTLGPLAATLVRSFKKDTSFSLMLFLFSPSKRDG